MYILLQKNTTNNRTQKCQRNWKQIGAKQWCSVMRKLMFINFGAQRIYKGRVNCEAKEERKWDHSLSSVLYLCVLWEAASFQWHGQLHCLLKQNPLSPFVAKHNQSIVILQVYRSQRFSIRMDVSCLVCNTFSKIQAVARPGRREARSLRVLADGYWAHVLSLPPWVIAFLPQVVECRSKIISWQLYLQELDLGTGKILSPALTFFIFSNISFCEMFFPATFLLHLLRTSVLE